MASELQGTENKFVSCMVDGDTVWFQGIVKTGADLTYMKIAYSVNLDLSSPAYSDYTSGAADTVLRIAIRNLPRGTKYYYRVLISSSTTFGDGTAPTDGDRYFVTQPTGAKPFKFIVISDAHLNGYQQHGDEGSNLNSANLNASDEPTIRTQIKRFSAGVLLNKPDLIVWLGDDLFHNLTEADRQTCYRSFAVATAELGVPQLFVPGNHEKENYDNAADCTDGATGKTHRETYLLHPQNHAPGRYGYTDYGPVRIIYLTPYAYSPLVAVQHLIDCGGWNWIRSTAPYRYLLGTEQRAFLNQVLSAGNQKLNIICMHEFPWTGNNNAVDENLGTPPVSLVNVMNLFGGITSSGLDLSYVDENAYIFNAIKNSGKQAIIFKGHDHCYAREVQQDGIYVYTCPAIFNWRTDPGIEAEVQAGGLHKINYLYYADAGYYDLGTNPHYLASDDSLAHLVVEVNPVSEAITTYGIDADGAEVTAVGMPRASIPFALHGDIVIG